MEKKSSNGILLGLLVGIILMLAVVFGLFVTGTISFTSEENSGNVTKSIKIDNSKYYVYDADYKANTKFQEYGKAFGNEFDTQMTHDGFDTYIVNDGVVHLKDLGVPYININTTEAKNINDNLKKLYDEYVQKYDEAANDFNDVVQKYGTDFRSYAEIDGGWFYPMLKYYAYESNNILSIVVTYGVLGTDILHPEYLVYNFDLSDGSLLNYNQILSKFNINNTEASSAVLKQVSQYVKSSESYISDYLSDTEENLKKSINDGTVLSFIDNQGNINYIVDIYMGAGSGKYPQKITVVR